jgi:dihydrolipoamide dehydrogenase
MVYQKLGTKIVVVELMDQLLPGTDLDLVKVVEKHLKKGGADIHLQSKATKLEKSGKSAKVTVEDRDGKTKVVECDKVLVAVGFRANSKNLGLEEVGVKMDQRGNVIVDDRLETNVKGIWSIGDLNGPPFLAHKASKEGETAAEIIAGHKSAADWLGMPAAIFTDPEIATVGITEQEAKKAGRKIRIGKFPFAVSGRAMSVLEPEGFVKVIIDEEDNRLLGVGIVGPEASDLISEAALAIEMCAFAEDVALTVHPHPTLGESVMEAFKHSIREAIHVMNR